MSCEVYGSKVTGQLHRRERERLRHCLQILRMVQPPDRKPAESQVQQEVGVEIAWIGLDDLSAEQRGVAGTAAKEIVCAEAATHR